MNLFAIFMRRIIVVGLAALSFGAPAQEKLYRINSKDVGWNTIDLTISETRRTPRTSELKVPRYGNRTSVEARFAMCAFTDLAFQRRYAVWIVSDGSITDDVVVVGFLKSEDEDAKAVLGEGFVGDNVLRANARVINRMCGIKEPSK